MRITAGTTSVIVYFKLVDAGTGQPATGLTITDLDLSYVRDQAAAVKSDLTAHGAVTDAWTANEAIEVDSTNTPGLYRVDVPDAAFATGVDRVQLVVIDGANQTIDSATIEVEMKGVDVDSLAGGRYKIADTSGNWGTNGTWSDNVQPAAGENIIIRDGVTVTVAASLDLGQFGTLEMQGDARLDINSGQTVAVVPRGWVISTSEGTVTDNYGTITNNYNTGIVTNNRSGGVINVSSGTITSNGSSGTIISNVSGGTVTSNSGGVIVNEGTVTDNYGVVEINTGTVTENKSTGIVLHNYGTIGTDNGQSDVPRVSTVTDGAKAAALATVDGNVDSILEIIQ